MHAVDFGYRAARSLDEAIDLLLEQDGAMPLAGGQSLVQAANLREVRPALLVDLTGLDELRGIVADETLRIGAGEPMTDIGSHPLVHQHLPLLVETLNTVGSVAIRNRATLGGSAAWADPTSQVPAAMLALDAVFVIQRSGGQRRVPGTQLFTGSGTTSLQRGEVIRHVEFPMAQATGQGLCLVRRTAITWPVAGCAAVREASAVRLGLFGAGATPILARSIDEVEAVIDPPEDAGGSADYRRSVLPELARRALADAGGGG